MGKVEHERGELVFDRTAFLVSIDLLSQESFRVLVPFWWQIYIGLAAAWAAASWDQFARFENLRSWANFLKLE